MVKRITGATGLVNTSFTITPAQAEWINKRAKSMALDRSACLRVVLREVMEREERAVRARETQVASISPERARTMMEHGAVYECAVDAAIDALVSDEHLDKDCY